MILTKSIVNHMNDIVTRFVLRLSTVGKGLYNMLRHVILSEVDDQDSGYQIEYPFDIAGAIQQVNGPRVI